MTMIAAAHLRPGDVVRDGDWSYAVATRPTPWTVTSPRQRHLVLFRRRGSRLSRFFLSQEEIRSALAPGALQGDFRDLPSGFLVEVTNR